MTNYILHRKGWGKSLPRVAEIAGVELLTAGQDDLFKKAKDADLVFRWGAIADLPRDVKVVNKSEAISETASKSTFRMKLHKNKLTTKTWDSFEEFLMDDKPALPVIVRPHEHSRSEDLHFCKTKKEVQEACRKAGAGYYISEYVEKDSEYRVFIAQGKVVWMIEKTPQNRKDISWGCVDEGEFEYVGWSEWPKPVLSVGLQAMALTKLDFGAVDVMMKNGAAYVLEINTAPHMTPYYAKKVGNVFKHIVAKGREFKYEPNKYERADMINWKNLIHPAAQ